MGINFDGVNPESKAKLDKIVQDGKITAEEVKGLTATEKEALAKGLGGVELPVEGEIRIGEEPKAPKQEKGFFGKVWDGVKDFAKTNTGKMVIGGAATVGALALTAATLGTGAAALVAAGGLALTLTSCGEGSSLFSVENDNDASVFVTVQTDPEIKNILAKILEAQQKSNNKQDTIIENQETMIENQKNMNNLVKELLDRMFELNASVDEMVKVLKEKNIQIGAIITALGDISGNQDKAYELLQKLVNNDNQKMTYLKEILNAVRNGNELQANELDILNKITSMLTEQNSMINNNSELLTKILAKLSEFAKQDGDMDSTTHDLLLQIINNQNSMSDSVKYQIGLILEKLDQMDENEKGRFKAIMSIITDLGLYATEILNAIRDGYALTSAQLQIIINKIGTQGDKLDDIKELIMKNNEIAQQTQDAVKDMSANMSAEHKAILEAIKNGTANVDQIQKILVEIRNNTSVLPDMKKQLCLIGTAIEKVLDEVKGIRTETKKGLLEILAKIPDGCHCQPTDLTAIIDLLNKLLDKIQKDPEDKDNNNESILTDLDKYFD